MNKVRAALTTALGSGALVAASLTCAPMAHASEVPAVVDAAPRTATISAATWISLESAVEAKTENFDGALALRAGVSTALVNDFATGWRAAGRTTTNATINAAEVTAITNAEPSPRACAGKNSADHSGLQYNYYLNSCNSLKLVGALAIGAGTATITAIIMAATGVGGAVAGIVAGALGVAGGIVTVCSSNGRGLVAHILQFTNVVWCNNQ